MKKPQPTRKKTKPAKLKMTRGPVFIKLDNKKTREDSGYLYRGLGVSKVDPKERGEGLWAVTHLASGMRVCLSGSLSEAREAVEALAGLDLDWTEADLSAKRDLIKPLAYKHDYRTGG